MGIENKSGSLARDDFGNASWMPTIPDLLPPLPQGVTLSDGLVAFEHAVDSWALLRAGLRAARFEDGLIGLESYREALSLGGAAVAPAELLRLMIVAATEDRPPPRELRASFQRLDAIRSGLAAVQGGAEPGLTAELLFELSVSLGGRGLIGRDLQRAQQAADDIERLLAETVRVPLLVRAAILAARIGIAAPFGVASPMLSRLMLPLLAAARGRTPLFLSDSLQQAPRGYSDALAVLAAGGSWESWIAYYAAQVAGAAEAAAARLGEAERVRDALGKRLETLRSHSNAHRLAERAITAPVLTVGLAQQMLGVSFQTANAAIAALVKLDVLRPHSSVRRNRIFLLAGLTPEPG